MLQPQYSALSVQMTKLLPKKTKKDEGIFITPRLLTEKLYSCVKQFKDPATLGRILEPSCGTCEMIQYLDEQLSGANIVGIEQNSILFSRIPDIVFSEKNEVNLIHQDFITYPVPSVPFDLIFGNPPYVVCKKESVPLQYREYISGRPNLFGIFILHSLAMLKIGGILAFIIPKSFLNSAYYASIRDFIKETCDIVGLLDFESTDEFLETQQATMGLVLLKREKELASECAYSLKLGGHYIFSPDSAGLKTLLSGSVTLQSLGLSVKTGSIVWNEKKELLTPDAEEGTLLLYNSNISKGNSIELKEFANNEEKFQYIMAPGSTEPVIVVNRGNGNSAYKLSYSLVDLGNKPYLVENHLNVVYSTQKRNPTELLVLFSKIIASFADPRTEEFIRIFLGNNGLSKTELESVFPIYM